MTCAESAAEIRAALKSRGISSRQVSVRADSYSMGSAVRIEIKDASVPLARVKAAAMKHERIDRDQWGEILNGGNRYVDIHYTSEARKALAEPWIPAAKAAADAVSGSALVPIDGTALMVGKPQQWDGERLSLWGPQGHIQDFYSIDSLAAEVGQRMVEQGPVQ